MSEKTIVVRRARLPFVKLRRGLIEARHREAMGPAIWLYLYFHSIADRKQGVAAVDLQQAAEELGVSQRSVRAMYTTLIDAEYLEPLRIDFEPATAQDRVAHRAPFVRIARYAEDPSGAQDARKEPAGTRKKASASTRKKSSTSRKKSSTSRKKSSTSRKISSGSRQENVDPSNRIADASEEAVEAVEAVEGGSAPPAAADQNPDQTQIDPPSGQANASGNGHPKPVAETPLPEPRATPGRNGQSRGQGNGQAHQVAERPPADLDDTPFTPPPSEKPEWLKRLPTDDPCDSEAWQQIEHEIVHGGWCPSFHFSRERKLKQECCATYQANPDPELWWSWLKAPCGVDGRQVDRKPGYFAKVVVPRIADGEAFQPKRGVQVPKPPEPVDPTAPDPDDFASAAFHAQAMALHREGKPWDRLTIEGQRHEAQETAEAVEVT